MKKDEARRQVKARKCLLDENEKATAAKAVFDMLERTAAFMMSENILMYHSLPDELSTLDFIGKWSSRKHFFLPRVNGVNLEILPYDRSSLRLGAFQIEEPQGDDVCPIECIEMIVVPGVAYDRSGNRVGRGKGYYDRLLKDSRATKIGVAYDFQVFDEVECEPHDVKVDAVITDKAVYRIHTKKHIL